MWNIIHLICYHQLKILVVSKLNDFVKHDINSDEIILALYDLKPQMNRIETGCWDFKKRS